MVLFKKIKERIISREKKKITRFSRPFPQTIKKISIWLHDTSLKQRLEKEITDIINNKWGNDVTIDFLYFNAKKRTKEIPFKNNEIFANDFDFLLRLKKIAQKKLIIGDSDILLNLTSEFNAEIEISLIRSKAKYILGLGGKRMIFYHDFMVNVTNQPTAKQILETLIHYLNLGKV